MRLTAEGKEVIVRDLLLVEGLDLYSSYLQVSPEFNLPLNKIYTLIIGDSEIEFIVDSVTKIGESEVVILKPKLYVQLLNSNIGKVSGEYSFEELANFIGAKSRLNVKTLPSYWNIPQSKVVTFLEHLNNYVNVINGGGARVYFDLDGYLNLTDLKSIFETVPTASVLGDILNEEVDFTWVNQIPGKVLLTENVWGEPQTEAREIIFEEGWGYGHYNVMCYNKKYKGQSETMLRNQFYRKYMTSFRMDLSIDPESVVTPGQLVEFLSNDVKDENFIVYESRRMLSSNNEQIAQVKLVSCQK